MCPQLEHEGHFTRKPKCVLRLEVTAWGFPAIHKEKFLRTRQICFSVRMFSKLLVFKNMPIDRMVKVNLNYELKE